MIWTGDEWEGFPRFFQSTVEGCYKSQPRIPPASHLLESVETSLCPPNKEAGVHVRGQRPCQTGTCVGPKVLNRCRRAACSTRVDVSEWHFVSQVIILPACYQTASINTAELETDELWRRTGWSMAIESDYSSVSARIRDPTRGDVDRRIVISEFDLSHAFSTEELGTVGENKLRLQVG